MLTQYLAGLAAVMVVGPRATGKTSTARRYAASVVRMDRPAEAAAFRADPDAALRVLPGPILLDEWQEVPEVLGAVKRAVDDGAAAGRFILTGSVRAPLSSATWPGTGRVVRVVMDGVSRRELDRKIDQPSLIGVLAAGATGDVRVPPIRRT